MANICINRLVITTSDEFDAGDGEKAIARFRVQAAQRTEQNAEGSELAIANFLPTPKELLDGNSPAPEDVAKANLEKYGAKDWYDWNIKNWGAKWDASDVSVNCDDESFLEYEFSSPWSPHIEAFTSISKMFPELVFQLHYDEPGMCFKGVATFKGGDVNDQCINY